ncbi:MAG: HEPN domain-containing protein [Nanoarchaeota archaeon]
MPMKPKEETNRLPNGVFEDADAKELTSKFIARADKNLELMNIISELSTNKEAQKALALPEEYMNDEWVIITAYYSMYLSALALLAKLGYRSKTHTATILALEMFFVKRELIEQKYLLMFKYAHSQINQQDITDLSKGKEDRETAQYEVTKTVTHSIAETSIRNAISFVNKVKELL